MEGSPARILPFRAHGPCGLLQLYQKCAHSAGNWEWEQLGVRVQLKSFEHVLATECLLVGR
jgi:hypothetical protein